MTSQSHIEALQQKYHHLSQKIEDGYLHHDSEVELEKMKKQRLKIMDEISSLKKEDYH